MCYFAKNHIYSILCVKTRINILTNNSYLYPNYKQVNINFSHGVGSYLYTNQGEEFLDFTSGVAVNALGHAHPYLINKLTTQAQKLWHISNLFPIEPQESLAKRLCDYSFANRVFFVNSGTEAVECAIKTARHYYYTKGQSEKYQIISFSGAFHGRTLGSLAATGRAKYSQGFGPICSGFKQLNLATAQKELTAQLATQTAAIIIEPIQGESGVNIIDNNFLQFLRNFCTEHGVLLIFDEIQTGIGRTGSLFAYEQTDVIPDIMTLAKGLGGGFPISACLCGSDIAQDMTIGTHGATFGGNFLATTTAHAVLDLVAEPEFLKNVKTQSKLLQDGLDQLKTKFPQIINKVKGRGLLLGLELNIESTNLINACIKQKLLTLGADNNVMRLIPPLIINQAESNLALTKLEAALNSL